MVAYCFKQFRVSGSSVFHAVLCFRQFSVQAVSVLGSSVFHKFQCFGQSVSQAVMVTEDLMYGKCNRLLSNAKLLTTGFICNESVWVVY